MTLLPPAVVASLLAILLGRQHAAVSPTPTNPRMEQGHTYLFGMRVDALAMGEAVERVLALARSTEAGPCRYVVTPNVNHVVLLSQRADFQAVYRDASLVVADGAPLLWVSRLLGEPLPGRIAGSDLVPAVFAVASSQGGLRVFFLGAAPGVAERAKLNVERECPGVRVVGCYSPPVGFEGSAQENERILNEIASVSPELLVLGLGAPKQELWVHRHRHRLHARVALCVGATIDFLAGEKARAPGWMRGATLEWLYRAAQEPRRLGPRYIRDGLRFPLLVLQELRARRRHRATRQS